MATTAAQSQPQRWGSGWSSGPGSTGHKTGGSASGGCKGRERQAMPVWMRCASFLQPRPVFK